MDKILFKATQVTKQYPGTLALNKVDMEIPSGKVIGLVGENGAGKSTLLKLIMGLETPSSGTMEINGKLYTPTSPIEANAMGIGMVFQEQSLILNLSVAQNMFFGQEKDYQLGCFLNKPKMNSDAQKVLENMGITNIKPEKKISHIDFASRQMIEIAKVFNIVQAANSDGSIVLLDEPTSVLNEEEVKRLFENIRKITAKGTSVIFISHRLDEVMEISDLIYVFKDGEQVAVLDKKDANEDVLYEKMVGRTATGEYYKTDKQTSVSYTVLLEAKQLGLHGAFADIDLTLHAGEVLGICGVIGSGKEDLCAVICGDEQHTTGELVVKGQVCNFNEPYEAKNAGILSIPKERREEGIIGAADIIENISISSYATDKKNGLINKKLQQQKAQHWIKELGVKCPSMFEKVNHLSGGNAQKVVFGRIMASNSDILVLNHPTRGVDIAAKEEIYLLVRKLTEAGKAVLLLGDTLDECIGLASKILVMKDGMLTGEFDALPENKPSQVDIVHCMM